MVTLAVTTTWNNSCLLSRTTDYLCEMRLQYYYQTWWKVTEKQLGRVEIGHKNMTYERTWAKQANWFYNKVHKYATLILNAIHSVYPLDWFAGKCLAPLPSPAGPHQRSSKRSENWSQRCITKIYGLLVSAFCPQPGGHGLRNRLLL